MEPKQNYLMVGVFVIAGFVGLAIAGLWVSGTLQNRDYETYHTFFKESVTGLDIGADVKYRGFAVGKVKDIAIDKEDITRIHVAMDVEEDAPVTADTVAVLKISGITGVAFVELDGSTNQSPPLEPGEKGRLVIPSRISTMTMIFESIPQILDNISRVTSRIASVMNQENMDQMKAALANVGKLTEALGENSGNISQALQDTQRAMAQLAETAETINGVAKSSEGDVKAALEKTALAMDQLTRLLEDTNAFSQDGYRETYSIMMEMKQTLREIRTLTDSIQQDPSKLIVPERKGGVKLP